MGNLTNLISTTPTYETVLPTSKQRVSYRPFLVKEEKILLIASESKNEKEISRAMNDVVSACTFGKVNMQESSIIDIEYLFLQIRSKSVGETTKPMVKCKKCNTTNEVQIDLTKIQPIVNPNHNSKIQLTDSVIVEMRYPKFSDIEKLQDAKTETQKIFLLMSLCIEKIYTKSGTFNSNDLEQNDVVDFIDNLTQLQFKKMTEFFESMPQMKYDVDYSCNKCGNQETLTLKGAQDFF